MLARSKYASASLLRPSAISSRPRPRFAATNGVGVAVFTNLSATAQGWLYKPDWNMMRVTRRGPGVPAEWFTCDLSSYYLYILMR